MDRRTSLATLLGRSQHNRQAASVQPLVTTGLEPFGGLWTRETAAHLLRRTTFGPDKALINSCLAMGLDAAVEQLFAELPSPQPPVYYDYSDDPNAGLFTTWINAPFSPTIAGMQAARARSRRVPGRRAHDRRRRRPRAQHHRNCYGRDSGPHRGGSPPPL